MSKRDDERRVIKNGQEKSYKVNRADDPESFFKFKLRRAHGKQYSGGRLLAKAFGPSVTKLLESFQLNRRIIVRGPSGTAPHSLAGWGPSPPTRNRSTSHI